jgi:Kef-type K+ transport system membrane component KefB
VLIVSIGIGIGSEITGFSYVKYTTAFTFGYITSIFWKEEKPLKKIRKFWFYFGPIYFGSVG